MKSLALAAVFVAVVAAQGVGPGNMPPGMPGMPGSGMSQELRQYLELTNDQLATIGRVNNEMRRYQLEKARRSAQVRLELQDETTKQTLDPMALGLRYAELENIQRELSTKAKETATQIQSVFTPAQKAKLQTLEQVLRTYPVACEAVNLNFITPQPTSLRWFDPSAFNRTDGTRISMPGIGIGCGAMPAFSVIMPGGVQTPGNVQP